MMTLEDLVSKIAEEAEMPKNATKKFISAFIEVVGDSLAGGEGVRLQKLGSFEVIDKAAKTQTDFNGNEITIPEHKAVKFKVSDVLKEKVK